MRPWRFKDANSKLIEVVTFGDVDAEKRVDDNLVEILKMKFYQDLCENLQYKLNPRVRCAFGNVSTCVGVGRSTTIIRRTIFSVLIFLFRKLRHLIESLGESTEL